MDRSNINAAALRKRVDQLTETMATSFLHIMQSVSVKDNLEESAKDAGEEGAGDNGKEYGQIAEEEAKIKQHTTALIKAVQDTSLFIRELQELWLFGRLDTLQDPADAEASRARAAEIASMVEELAKVKMAAEDFAKEAGDVNKSPQINGHEVAQARPSDPPPPPNDTTDLLGHVEAEDAAKPKKKKKNKHNNRKKNKDKKPVPVSLVPYSSDSDSPATDTSPEEPTPAEVAGTLTSLSQSTQDSYVTARTGQTEEAYFSALE
ncbi:hypothetical protein P154DRAFT_573973 [Amniculicola lignicola CBS 123094]|uniref:Mediator of RNA polymerase II transcription subunit 22 n=1 Tax=Amniculicola lignicola CBS 123094 TaxID=1392246 RepID=A0A6A5WNS1_9PLEO|nr:hypothetical protein P154DRAFT_573973 [Amniculicola lignicola CBS 123094]